jgi:hypothetical protein
MILSKYINNLLKNNVKVKDGCGENKRGYESTIGKEERGAQRGGEGCNNHIFPNNSYYDMHYFNLIHNI